MSELTTQRIWKNRSPDPIPIKSCISKEKIPSRFSSYYHGQISRENAEKILSVHASGAFLVRESSSKGAYALSLKYKNDIKNYILHYDESESLHYVGTNKFPTVESLVKDGLIHFHIESEGQDILNEIAKTSTYETTPYRLRYKLMEEDKLLGHRTSPHLVIRDSPESKKPISRLVDESRKYMKSSSDEGSTLNWRRNSPKNLNHNKTGSESFNEKIKVSTNTKLLQKRYQIPGPCCVTDESSISSNDSSTKAISNGKEIHISHDKIVVPLPKDKSHVFKIHTFIGPNWCDFCNNFLWGLIGQGYQCTDCGFQAHKKCSEIAPCDCLPIMKFMRRVFAVDLIALVRAENGKVPIVLIKCIEEIEKRNGLNSEGIYRVPGNLDHMEDLRKAFDKNADAVNLAHDERVMDVNVLASLIKNFMKQLPNPLIPFTSYNDFVNVAKESNPSPEITNLSCKPEKIEFYCKLVHELPLEHYNTLKYFIAHLNRVSQHSEKNLMTCENLALVLTPSLLYSSYNEFSLKSLRYERAVLVCLIKEYSKIFPDFS